MPESVPKRERNDRGEFCPGGGGALNNQAFAQPYSRTEHAPGVPKGTVADFGWDQEDEGLFFRDFHDSRVISLFARRYLLKGIVLSGVVSGNG